MSFQFIEVLNRLVRRHLIGGQEQSPKSFLGFLRSCGESSRSLIALKGLFFTRRQMQGTTRQIPSTNSLWIIEFKAVGHLTSKCYRLRDLAAIGEELGFHELGGR